MATIDLGAANFQSTVSSNDIVLAAAAQITSIPTLIAFTGGTLAFSQPGSLPAAALEEVITGVRALDSEAALAKQKPSA